jgi:uncharacterized protein with HEPN domain
MTEGQGSPVDGVETRSRRRLKLSDMILGIVSAVAILVGVSALGVIIFNMGKETGKREATPEYKWTVLATFDNEFINDIWALDDTHVWAVGSLATSSDKRSYKSEGGVVNFYNGRKWTEQFKTVTTAQNEQSLGDLTTVSACDAKHAWAGSQSGTIYFFNGSRWAEQHDFGDEVVVNIFALDRTHVWAVGGNKSKSSIHFFNGDSWSEQTSLQGTDYSSGFTDVFAVDTGHVWAVAQTGFYFYDGRSWSRQWTDRSGVRDVFVQGVAAADENHVWATSGNGDTYFSDGKSWRKLSQAGQSLSDKWCIAVASANCVWTAGKQNFVSFWDGMKWSIQRGEGFQFTNTGSISAADTEHVYSVKAHSVYAGVIKP